MESNFSKESISPLEEAIGYQFKDIILAEEAFSHPSLKQVKESTLNYERLELLGDSILGFLVTELIFKRFTSEEGILAKIKAHVVGAEILVKISESLGLADYIIMTNGEEKSGGRLNPNNLENTLEALIGAIYLDSNIDSVRAIVANLWAPYIENVDFSASDPKTFLQELVQRNGEDLPKYTVIGREGSDHSPLFTVEVKTEEHTETGDGKSIKEAQKNAARMLLGKINN
ncbi:MAG: ribonuclease III [Rickettsiales bacterium]|nr:MAG: ribonuclease III [Rickettsiales bacterium]